MATSLVIAVTVETQLPSELPLFFIQFLAAVGAEVCFALAGVFRLIALLAVR
jgi:hypothetical protein